MSYAEVEKRVNLSIEHYKKPCLHGDCGQDDDVVVHCERHADTSAIVRRYLRLQEYREIKELAFVEDVEHAIQCRMDEFYQGRS